MSVSLPKVSIGLPVYNGERYLRECLDCLLNQTFRDFEIVISDNASTDKTQSICQHYASLDERIHYHQQKVNRGANWNFNQVFHLSRGEYFKWAAVDDLCSPTYLDRMTETLETHPDCVWCHSLTVHIDEAGNKLDEAHHSNEPYSQNAHSLVATGSRLSINDVCSASAPSRFAAVLLGTTWCSDSFGLIRSDVLAETALEGPFYGAEKVLMSELAIRGQFIEIPEVMFFQRIHPDASGSMASGNDRDEFTFGVDGSAPHSTSFAILRGYHEAIQRADLSRTDRLRCYGHLMRYVFQLRKLTRKIVRSASRYTPSMKTPIFGHSR
ncbi:glycosyltransferase family 2 protein [Thalassoroseus pseudoceratinae]|uniref:glycosyltransferase family 2 protein n=1 Tax=Thalassoroseus pseudoceratinae TaxID=2713176 RepID=UPI001420BF35|nr:glycosyltransferase family A protein [Thalassoroseus pseudoceratinae]